MRARIENHGSICLFRPVDDEASGWAEAHIDQAAVRLGEAVAVEPRFLGDLAAGFQADGGALEAFDPEAGAWRPVKIEAVS